METLNKEQFYAETSASENNINEYTRKCIEATEAVCEEISQYAPAHVEYKVRRGDDGSVYFEHTDIRITGTDITARKSSQGSKSYYSFFPSGARLLPNLSNHRYNAIRESKEEPNRIGVLSQKKVDAWIKFCTEVNEDAKKESDENTAKIEAFLKSIENEEVRYHGHSKGNKYAGTIVKNGIEFTYKISEGYISQKVALHYSVPNDIESFRKLSESQYKQEHKY